MEKRKIKDQMQEKIEETIGYLEEQCSGEQLFADGLWSMLYIRYQNARSVLRDSQAGYSRVRGALQFLTSANRAWFLRRLLWRRLYLQPNGHYKKKPDSRPYQGDFNQGNLGILTFLNF